MIQDELIATLGQGYTFGHTCPIPFCEPLLEKMRELAKASPKNTYWPTLLKGFELGVDDQKKERSLTLKKSNDRKEELKRLRNQRTNRENDRGR